MAELLTGDNQRRTRLTAADILHRRLERVEETRASRRNIESRRIHRPDIRLHIASRRRREGIRRNRRDNDEVNLLGLDPRRLHRLASGVGGHIARLLIGRGNAALLNARALNNPLIGRIHHLLEIRVRKAAFRDI